VKHVLSEKTFSSGVLVSRRLNQHGAGIDALIRKIATMAESPARTGFTKNDFAAG